MAPSKTSIAKWKTLSKQGVKWGTVAKSNASDLNAYAAKLKADPSLFLKPGFDPKLVAKFSADPTWADNNPLFQKALAKFKNQQPHKAPSKFSQVASSIAHTVIPAVAVGAIGAGIAGAASSALSGGSVGTVGTGAIGTGASGNAGFGGVQQLLGGQDGPMGFFDSIGDTLDDFGNTLEQGAGIYDKVSGLFGKPEHSGSKSLGTNGDGSGDAYAAQAPSGGGMSGTTMLLIGGAALFAVVLLLRK